MIRKPILPGNYPSLRIDSPTEGAETRIQLNIYEDIYKQQFYPHAHHNFIGTEPIVGDHFVVSVLAAPTKPTLHTALKIMKKGYSLEAFVIPDDPNIPLVDRITNALPNFVDSRDPIYPVYSSQFPSDILRIEEKHPQKRTTMKIGLVYCRRGQNYPQEMFRNGLDNDECSPKFWNFLELIGERINLEGWNKYSGDMKGGGISYYTEWNSVEVIYHVAPLLNSEGHRRLIGNDIAVMFFLEEGEDTYFDPSSAVHLGTVPQIFAVIQPVGDKYRLGFFANINIKQFDPPLPMQELLDSQLTKQLLLTKMYNGLVMANYCSPMNRLFYVPRKETIESIISNYPMETRRERRAREKKERKEKETRITLDDTEVTFENNIDVYSDINALVLLVATNLAYHEGRIIKSRVERELGFKRENVESFEIGDVQGYIASDNEKIFIIFGGLLNVKNLKKTLKNTKVSVAIANVNEQITLKGAVHKGYANPVIGLWDRVDEVFRKVNKGQSIWFAGHSLGSAVAMLTGHLFAERIERDAPDGEFKKNRISGLYLYGCPKVGDINWSKSYDGVLKSQTYRVIHANDLVPYLGTKAFNWYHGGNAYPTQANGMFFNNFRLNTPQSASSHQIPGYYSVLAPLHKIALERTLKDLRRDRIYSRSMKHVQQQTALAPDPTWDETSKRHKAVNDITVEHDYSDLNDPGPEQDICISRPSRRHRPPPSETAKFRRSKSLNSLNAFVDEDSNGSKIPTLTSAIEESLSADIVATKLGISNLLKLLSTITGDYISEDSDLRVYDHLRHTNGNKRLLDSIPKTLTTNSTPTNSTKETDNPTSFNGDSRNLRRSHSLNTLLNSGTDMNETHQTNKAINPKITAVNSPRITPSRAIPATNNSNKEASTVTVTPVLTSKPTPNRLVIRPSMGSDFGSIPRIPASQLHYRQQQQPVVPVLPPRAAVQMVHSRQSQHQYVTPQQQEQQARQQQQQTTTVQQQQQSPQQQSSQQQQSPQQQQSSQQSTNQRREMTNREGGITVTTNPVRIRPAVGGVPVNTENQNPTRQVNRNMTQPAGTSTYQSIQSNSNNSEFLAERERRARERLAQQQQLRQQELQQQEQQARQQQQQEQQLKQQQEQQERQEQQARQQQQQEQQSRQQQQQQEQQARQKEQLQKQQELRKLQLLQQQARLQEALALKKQQQEQQQARSLQRTKGGILNTPSQRVPRDIRQVRTRSKSLNELVIPQQVLVAASQKNSVGNSKRPLFVQLKSNLVVLQDILNMLTNANLADPPSYFYRVSQSFEKPMDTILALVQRLQSGRSESENLERKLYNFSKFCPKNKQVFEGFKRGAIPPQIMSDYLTQFKKAVDELLDLIITLMQED